ECVEMQVKGRHDHICLEMLQAMDLSDVDAVVMEHPRYPKAMRWLKKTHPRIRMMIRGHNAEAIHQLHTAWAFLTSGLSGGKWRFKGARMTLNNLKDRLGFDLSCARLSDYVLSISDWEAVHYWPRITGREKVLVVPYFVPEEYVFHPPADLQKINR